jgi:MFS family permease
VFVRLFHWQASSIEVVYGIILAGPGALGIAYAGWLADRAARRGGRQPLELAAIALALVVPVSLWVGLALNPDLSLAALVACSFLLAMPTGLAPLAIYQITPNEHRGQTIAVYLLAATTVGLGAGPVVASTNAALFGDDLAIGLALAIVTMAAAIVGFLLLSWAGRLARARVTSSS